jgi:hypothetical protein
MQLAKLAAALGTGQARLAEEREFGAAFPDCAVGRCRLSATCTGVPVYVDRSLTADESLVLRAGTHTDTMRIACADFARLVGPTVVDIPHVGRPKRCVEHQVLLDRDAAAVGSRGAEHAARLSNTFSCNFARRRAAVHWRSVCPAPRNWDRWRSRPDLDGGTARPIVGTKGRAATGGDVVTVEVAPVPGTATPTFSR